MGLIQQEDKKTPLCPAYLMHSTVFKLTYSTYCIVAMVTLQYTVSHMAYIYIGIYICKGKDHSVLTSQDFIQFIFWDDVIH